MNADRKKPPRRGDANKEIRLRVGSDRCPALRAGPEKVAPKKDKEGTIFVRRRIFSLCLFLEPLFRTPQAATIRDRPVSSFLSEHACIQSLMHTNTLLSGSVGQGSFQLSSRSSYSISPPIFRVHPCNPWLKRNSPFLLPNPSGSNSSFAAAPWKLSSTRCVTGSTHSIPT